MDTQIKTFNNLAELKTDFLAGNVSTPKAIAWLTKLTTGSDFFFEVGAASQVDSHRYLVSSRMNASGTTNTFTSKAEWRTAHLDCITYSDTETPQDWDIADIEYGPLLIANGQPVRSPVLLRLDNNWWLACNKNGLRTVEWMYANQNFNNNYFKDAHTDTGHRLKPEFL
jgi:hypothetical protein